MPFFNPKYIKGNSLQVGLYAAITVFLTYTMVFGFRKSFTVATFDGIEIAGYSYKTILVISQVLGYMLAKFYGIKYISELKKHGRGCIILLLTAASWLSWLLFALVPPPYNVAFLFINGFPLGMLWGVVFSYVEGRRSTDFIGATLAVSFIFASGFVKTVGGWLLLHFNSVFFERLIATFRHIGNVGFLIYLADSFGYLGSVGVLLSKEIFKVQLNWVTFFSNSVIGLSIAGLALTIFSAVYFSAKFEALIIKNSQS